MKRFVPRTSAVLCAIALGACGGGETAPRANGPESPKAKVLALEESGAIPKLERGPTLEGVDANGNGIRDDIDAFIDRSYSTEPQRRAARQLAANLQKILLVNKSDKAALRQVETGGWPRVHCVFLRFVGRRVKQACGCKPQLESVTANTKNRLKAYLAYSKAMDGTVISFRRAIPVNSIAYECPHRCCVAWIDAHLQSAGRWPGQVKISDCARRKWPFFYQRRADHSTPGRDSLEHLQRIHGRTRRSRANASATTCSTTTPQASKTSSRHLSSA